MAQTLHLSIAYTNPNLFQQHTCFQTCTTTNESRSTKCSRRVPATTLSIRNINF